MTRRRHQPFTWAEEEWLVFCAARGISLAQCSAAMGRDYRVVLHKARAMMLRLRLKPRSGNPDPAARFRSESARHAAIARWSRLKEAA